MKSIPNKKFIWHAALALVFLGTMTGCCGGATPDGGGGAGGRNCTWNPADAGVPIPDCSGSRTTVHFVGMLDGNPIDEQFNNNPTAIDPILDDYESKGLSVVLPASGYLRLSWGVPTPSEEWIDVEGNLLWPLEKTPRPVKEGSRFRFTCGGFLYQYILVVDGGQLNACSVN